MRRGAYVLVAAVLATLTSCGAEQKKQIDVPICTIVHGSDALVSAQVLSWDPAELMQPEGYNIPQDFTPVHLRVDSVVFGDFQPGDLTVFQQGTVDPDGSGGFATLGLDGEPVHGYFFLRDDRVVAGWGVYWFEDGMLRNVLGNPPLVESEFLQQVDEALDPDTYCASDHWDGGDGTLILPGQ